MKKGFTLIELLAVIVILAIAALISVPLILGVIENTKVSAFKSSLSMVFSEYGLYSTSENEIPEDGLDVTLLNLKNNFKYGNIIVNNDGETELVNLSNGVYCGNGTLNNYTVYKGECDTVNPLAPSVSVENSVYATTKEYTLSAPSTMSGIKSYEYYLSDTTDTPSSDVVISGSSKTNKITINKVSKYVFFRVVSKANLKGEWSSAKTNYVDLTDPTASLSTNTITSKSITLSAVCVDNESGITKYEFSKDNGTTYINNGTGSAYTFNDLTSGNYTFKVKCTSGALIEVLDTLSASTVTIDTPTYSINPTGYATSKTLTINYPSGYTNEYSLDGGTSWLTYTAPIVFNANGNLIARVNDGTNYITGSSYAVTNIDTTIPTVTTSVTGITSNITLGDNLQLSGYTVTTSATVPTAWTNISGTTSSQVYTASTYGTYYAWVKDAAGNTASSSFVIIPTSFCTTSVGQTWTFTYTGAMQTFTVPTGCIGTYRLEAWGAQGYTINTYRGGYGAYATGSLHMDLGTTLYISVGQQGSGGLSTGYTSYSNGGAGGGGDGVSYAGSGGSSTNITLSNNVLSSFSSNYSSGVILVAAGGGAGTFTTGNGWSGYGGSGGGIAGVAGVSSVGTFKVGGGATQTAGGTAGNSCLVGSFGTGAGKVSTGTGGGGGLYGGGCSWGSAGGGGSSYIGNASLITSGGITKHMTCYNCTASTVDTTYTITTTNVSATPTTDYAKSGAGYAKITLLSIG